MLTSQAELTAKLAEIDELLSTRARERPLSYGDVMEVAECTGAPAGVVEFQARYLSVDAG